MNNRKEPEGRGFAIGTAFEDKKGGCEENPADGFRANHEAEFRRENRKKKKRGKGGGRVQAPPGDCHYKKKRGKYECGVGKNKEQAPPKTIEEKEENLIHPVKVDVGMIGDRVGEGIVFRPGFIMDDPLAGPEVESEVHLLDFTEGKKKCHAENGDYGNPSGDFFRDALRDIPGNWCAGRGAGDIFIAFGLSAHVVCVIIRLD
jgi:hypothetical protein